LSPFFATGWQRTTMPSHLISSWRPSVPGMRGRTIVSAIFDSGDRKCDEVQ
jgi:hypothetical protein